MELLLNAKLGKARRVTEGGRDYLVAPLTLIVPGVLNGSKGALYYPAEEVRKNYHAWNGTPMTLYHPTGADGANVSASADGVLDRSGLGVVRNAKIAAETGKLRAEGWFDVQKTRAVAPQVYAALNAGRPIELSTGLFTNNVPAANGSACPKTGRPYLFVARDYRPDHVAILPDQTGACSVKDGCGVFNAVPTHQETAMTRTEAAAYLTANCACWQGDGAAALNGLPDAAVLAMADREKAQRDRATVADDTPVGNADPAVPGHCGPGDKKKKQTGPSNQLPKERDMEPTGNLTQEQLVALLPDSLKQIIANANTINAMVRDNKARLIQQIVANASEADKPAAVAALDKINDLADLGAIAKVVTPTGNAAGGRADNGLSVADRVIQGVQFGPRLPNYAGAGVFPEGGRTDNADLDQENALGPTSNSLQDVDDDPIRKKLRAGRAG